MPRFRHAHTPATLTLDATVTLHEHRLYAYLDTEVDDAGYCDASMFEAATALRVAAGPLARAAHRLEARGLLTIERNSRERSQLGRFFLPLHRDAIDQCAACSAERAS